ncbi:MAG: TldD/PmbA family protein [Gammaproteobacteria bacterium]|nr:TldD/PmbA family protein [Gammaproteobacteria bacterium]
MLDALRDAFPRLRSAAPFWSLRGVAENHEALAIRQDTPEPPRFAADQGAMLTAVTDGGYGYCATGDLSQAGLQAALDRAGAWAEATRKISVHRYDPRRMPAPRGEYMPAAEGASELPRRALLELLADECRRAKVDDRIVERVVGINRRDVEQLYLTSTGGDVQQRFRYTVPYARVVANHGADTQARSFEHPRQGGLGTMEGSGFDGCGERLAREALQLLAAPNCPTGTMDLLLMPDQMMLQIHESIGHPLELDRILGDERNYAGTSFVTTGMIGSYRYGSELLNVTHDPSLAAEVAAFAFDDDGSPAHKIWLIRDGILQQPLGGHLSQARAAMTGTANARACSWNRPPIDRMANLNVEPGTSTLEDMIASIGLGVLMRTNLSWSIDDSRNKFQFGCEWGELIRDGQIRGVVKNPNYRGVSATFWRSLRMVGDPATFEVHGTLYCGKGEPNQGIHTGHASPACLFTGASVFGGDAT